MPEISGRNGVSRAAAFTVAEVITFPLEGFGWVLKMMVR